MSEEKKSTGRFHINLFDVLLVLLAVLCVVGIWQRKNLQQLFEDEQTTDVYTVSFEIRRLRDTSVQYLTAGATLYVESGDERVPLGTLASEVAVVDAWEYLEYEEDGKITPVQAYYPEDFSTVRGVLNTHGLVHDGAFLVEGLLPLSVNQTLVVHTESADFEILITAIGKVG